MSFGSALGAIVSLRNNRRPGKGRHKKHLAGKEAIYGIKSHRKPSAEELEAIRKRLKAENRRRQEKLILFTIVLLMALIAFFSYYMF